MAGWWWDGFLALGLDEAGLKGDDVGAERVVFGFDRLETLLHEGVVADLLFELLDVALLALTESTLLLVSFCDLNDCLVGPKHT